MSNFKELESQPHTNQRQEIEPKPYAAHHDGMVGLETDVYKKDDKADAMAAEHAEHAMSVSGAARAYPMACFWAFIMSFTIVSDSSVNVHRTRCSVDRPDVFWLYTRSVVYKLH
jgi:hypothetical protein